jgi:hypothetical protein
VLDRHSRFPMPDVRPSSFLPVSVVLYPALTGLVCPWPCERGPAASVGLHAASRRASRQTDAYRNQVAFQHQPACKTPRPAAASLISMAPAGTQGAAIAEYVSGENQ